MEMRLWQLIYQSKVFPGTSLLVTVVALACGAVGSVLWVLLWHGAETVMACVWLWRGCCDCGLA